MDLSPVTAFVAGFPEFLAQLGAAVAMFVGSLIIYVLLTPHDELRMIREGNPSAGLAFAGVVIGLAIPLSTCLAHAFGLLDLVIWGVVTLLLQLLAFRITDMLLRGLPKRIAEGDVASAIMLMSVKIGIAIILSGAVSDPALGAVGIS